MAKFEYSIRDVFQQASGGSRCAHYNADVEILPLDRGTVVEVINTVPAVADAELLRKIVDAIQDAAESVVRTRGHGVLLQLRRLYIHDVDSRPTLYYKLTAAALAKALEENQA
jgi:hypothetical protein